MWVAGKATLHASRALGARSPPTATSAPPPHSVTFNAQWFRLAVDPGTGAIRILRSVHADGAGKVRRR
ncbi:hypothetical protein OG301_29210 [Streptomyces platensis]|uniref:hypothetical protein n=1 Tax=Streptomyces platensis TaxID=58346 RepID=UPI002ED0CEC6|nr:hypothetical protein OG301_29210 [Streptomyces platensis]